MNLADREYCTGCAACVNACVKSAIDMRADEEGFLQPNIDTSKCISCGACERVCPIIVGAKFRPDQIEKTPLCGLSRDMTVWRESTSGGAFTEICNSLADRNPAVFGARFVAVDRVIIDAVESATDIGAFRKSKYVQAEVGDALVRCREYLESGRFVIFSGTPCQIAGLRTYLAKDYENLLTIEFICHGVGSPKVFSDCLRVMSPVVGGKIVRYGFRSKKIWPISSPHASCHELKVLGLFRYARFVSLDLYNRFFLNQLCLRRSCMEHCHFRDQNRYADITLADCRAERELYPDKDDKNWSVVIANTKFGSSVVASLSNRMYLRPYTVELLKKTNPLYFRTTPGNCRRGEFFIKYLQGVGLNCIAKGMVPEERDFLLRCFVKRCYRYIKRKLSTVVKCGGAA